MCINREKGRKLLNDKGFGVGNCSVSGWGCTQKCEVGWDPRETTVQIPVEIKTSGDYSRSASGGIRYLME